MRWTLKSWSNPARLLALALMLSAGFILPTPLLAREGASFIDQLAGVEQKIGDYHQQIDALRAATGTSGEGAEPNLAPLKTAQRARKKIREDLIDELTGWEKLHRQSARARHYLPPGEARDAQILLASAQRQAVKIRADDISDLQTIALDLRRTHAGVVGQAALFVQLAQYSGEEKSAQKERQHLVNEAKKPQNQPKVRQELQKTDEELENSLGMLLKNDTEEDFHRLKGTLRAPVPGEVAEGYGPQKQPNSMSYVRHTGLTWQVEEGTKVQTVAAGLVVFAGRMKGFGELVIIDHGQKYHSVYAHLKSLDVKVGQALQRGAQIGLSGETGSFDGPKLYFEMRKNGHPIDPTPWFLRP